MDVVFGFLAAHYLVTLGVALVFGVALNLVLGPELLHAAVHPPSARSLGGTEPPS